MGCCCSKKNKIRDEPKREAITFKQNIQTDYSSSFEFDVNEWKLLVEKLQANKKLEEYTLSLKRTQLQDINELILYLSRYDFKNDSEKAWSIYVWITNNIVYNVNGFRTGDYGSNDSASVLETGFCVCEGYASLFVDLSTGLGLKCKKIIGFAKGFGYKIGDKLNKMNHAWNAVIINNKYYFIESTWGAGTCTDDFKFIKRFNPYWFCTPAQVFIYTHYAESFQLQVNKITLKEYENMPVFGLQYHLFELKCLTHDSSSICSMETPLVIEFAAKKDVLLIADLKMGPNFEQIIENSVLVQRDAISNNYALFVLIPEKNKNFKLNIYAKYERSKSELFENVTNFLVSRLKDDLNLKIPKYTLIYDNDIKCESHHCELIQAQKNPINLIFSVPFKKSMIGDLRKDNGEIIENSVLVQRSLDQSKYEIKVILPVKNEFYELNLFSKNNDSDNFDFMAKFRMTRDQNQTNNNDQIKFISIYQNDLIESHIFSPVEYNLKLNKVHLFKVYFKNVYKVALVDIHSNWIYLENVSDSIWCIEKSFSSIGDITLFVKTASTESNFEAICSYCIG